MTKAVFIDLLWHFDEIMMQRDYFRSQIGRCGEGCYEEDEGLCPQCLVLFKEVQTEDDKLAMNRELDAVLKKLRQDRRVSATVRPVTTRQGGSLSGLQRVH
jgi:hypothetical protein